MMLKNHEYTYSTKVRIDDINFGNHLCHTRFINLMHNARALFLNSHHVSELDFYGYSMVMLNLNIDYRGECFFNDDLEITLKIDQVDKATVVIAYNIYNTTSKKISATATTTMGFVNPDTKKLVRIPNEFKKLFYYN